MNPVRTLVKFWAFIQNSQEVHLDHNMMIIVLYFFFVLHRVDASKVCTSIQSWQTGDSD